MANIDQTKIKAVGDILRDQTRPLAERYRALFTLKNVGGEEAIDSIARCFTDPSCLLKHECAYCLGQMENPYAIPILSRVLTDQAQEAMVRHEAGESLGAIGSPESLDLLEEYSNDADVSVAETCQLAVERIKWIGQKHKESLSANPYNSVDPAPPAPETDIHQLKETLVNESLPLFKRYRAMFALRNIGTTEAIHALGAGFKCSSALFRHEVAYVLGQMQNEASVLHLRACLEDQTENSMVRHECAEALGSIATTECMDVLQTYIKDQETVVKESCEVALDMYHHEKSGQFQYADGLLKVNSELGTS